MKNKNFRHAANTAALLCVLVLAACGGGSDDDGTQPVRPLISEETARLRRMGLPEGTATPAASSNSTGTGAATPNAAPPAQGL